MVKFVVGGVACFVGFLVFVVLLMGAVRVAQVNAKARQDARPQQVAQAAVAPVAPQPKTVPGYDPSKKAERDEFIDKMQAKGIFGDIKMQGHMGRLVVGRTFMVADFEAKKAFTSVAFGWCLDHDIDCLAVTLHDPQSNKEVGRYSLLNGGLTMH